MHRVREFLTAAALHQQTNEPAQHRRDTVRHIVMSAARETVGIIAPHSNRNGNSDIAAKTSKQKTYVSAFPTAKMNKPRQALNKNKIRYNIQSTNWHYIEPMQSWMPKQ